MGLGTLRTMTMPGTSREAALVADNNDNGHNDDGNGWVGVSPKTVGRPAPVNPFQAPYTPKSDCGKHLKKQAKSATNYISLIFASFILEFY